VQALPPLFFDFVILSLFSVSFPVDEYCSTEIMSDDEYDFGAEFQAVFIPKQKPAPPPFITQMGASVSSYPPLGQVTQVKNGGLTFVVLLDVEEKDAQLPWEVSLWHSSSDGDSTWSESTLSLIRDGPAPATIQEAQGPTRKTRLYFNGSVSISTSLQFTIKFRNAPHEPWRWTREEQRMDDGVIIVNPEKSSIQTATELSDVVDELNPALKVKSVPSQAPGTKVWTIEAPVDAAKGEDSSYADLRFGVPWGGFLR
jgi:hypothetical protein